jgi:hypothetical protein
VADAKRFGADIFVSIHHDWKGGEQAVIYSNTNDSRETRARRLAGFVNRNIDQAVGIPNGGIYADRRGLTVLKATMPAIIVEASRVQDPYVVKRMAEWIVHGMCDYYGVGYKATATAPKPKPKPKPSLPTLKQGASGSAVVKLQKALAKKGFKVTADGQFGPKTRAVVEAFQKKAKLTADGIVGPKTWKALGY